MRYHDRALITDAAGTPVLVENFSEPLIARHVTRTLDVGSRVPRWKLEFPYGVSAPLDLERIYSDEWDRFHGWAEISGPDGAKNKLNFVMGRTAQADFFNLVDKFDDEGFLTGGKKYIVQPLLEGNEEVRRREFWSQRYRAWKDEGTKPGWDLGEAAPPLRDILPQLKLMKQRIAVVGAGSAHDAAYLAKQGHLVTAIDISPEALDKARALYSDVKGLEFVCADVLVLPPQLVGRFDIVFEHTFYCSVDPVQRGKVINSYRQLLIEGGHLLGIFFVMSLGGNPPFGVTEWEVRERMKKGFNFLYWTRWKKSAPGREGKELVVYAQKK